MEGRRSRTKPAEVENAKTTPATPKRVSPLQGKATVAVKNAVDDRCVPTVGGENKRKRAPRGPAGRNVKAKAESVNEDETKVDSAPEEVSVSSSGGFRESQTPPKDEDRSGTENDESGVNSKEQTERRRGSSRLRIRPSKFRESVPTSSSKVKGELKNGEDRVDVLLRGTKATPRAAKPKDDDHSVQLVPSQVDTRELIARMFSSRKDPKSKSTSAKDKEPSTSSPVVPNSPDRGELKAVLLALKRVMKMKEAEPFNKPVDPVKLGIPDYLEIVTRPMDLGTIRNRLEKGEVYNTVDDVFEDVALVWSNCRKYNDDGDPIMELLENLESTFKKLCLAAGSPFHAINTAEAYCGTLSLRNWNDIANSEKSKSEELHQQKDDNALKKKNLKDVQPDAVALFKTKIKRSAPVDQVMAESKAREQKCSIDVVNLEDQDGDVRTSGVSSSGADKQVETPQIDQESEDEEIRRNDHETLQGPVTTPPVKEAESAPARYHRKPTSSQPVNMPAKVKRPNGHSTLTHRQGCLCVVCVGRRKREAKLRKSGAHLKASRSAKKNPEGPNSGDPAVETEEPNLAEDADDVLYGYSDNHQGYTSANFQLPLRKLDPHVVNISRLLFGSKPGSLWNRPRSLGYVSLPHPTVRVGLADAIASL